LVLVTPSTTQPGQFVMVCREAIDGINVRADNLNERLDYGKTVNISLYAYQWGVPMPAQTNGQNNTVAISIQPPTQAFFGGQMVGSHKPTAPIPYVNTPAEGLSLPDSINIAGENGMSLLSVFGNKIDTPRDYIDGQMYYITYLLNNQQPDPAWYSMDYIYINLRTYYEVPENPTWDDVSPTLTQFGNIYPLMSKYIVDLGNQEAVLSKKDILIYAFTRDINDPFYMPATRDLSDAMRETIVKWLNNPLPGTGDIKKAQVTTAADSTPEVLNESEEIKRVRALTEAKNGAKRFADSIPSPFANL
jgi:hypothetical protein